MNEKIWKSDQKIVMNEELVQNSVMNEKFLKNFVMNAKIDPKVVMDLSIFSIGGWKILQLSDRKLLEEFIEEAVLQLSGILNSDSSLVMHYVGTSTCEGRSEGRDG